MPVIFESKQKETKPVLHKSSSKPSYFSPFIINPTGRFDSQGNEEEIILLVRAHPITQAPWIIISVIFFLLPLFVSPFLTTLFSPLQMIFIYFAWYSFILSFMFANFLNYLFNIGIVTNGRVIDIDYNGLLYKEINASPFSRIEDVTVKSSGLINSLFQFGDIMIQTAGQFEDICFESAPHPFKVAKIINDQMSKSYGYYRY